jgi:uncharacterized integral membrane protein
MVCGKEFASFPYLNETRAARRYWEIRMFAMLFKDSNRYWTLATVGMLAAIVLLFVFNPLNTTSTQWIGPAKEPARVQTN